MSSFVTQRPSPAVTNVPQPSRTASLLRPPASLGFAASLPSSLRCSLLDTWGRTRRSRRNLPMLAMLASCPAQARRCRYLPVLLGARRLRSVSGYLPCSALVLATPVLQLVVPSRCPFAAHARHCLPLLLLPLQPPKELELAWPSPQSNQ